MSVSLDSMKAHLGITEDHDDALISEKIAVATALVEAEVGKPLDEFDPLPAPLAEAIRQVAASLYENREAVLTEGNAREVPFGTTALIDPYRVWIV